MRWDDPNHAWPAPLRCNSTVTYRYMPLHLDRTRGRRHNHVTHGRGPVALVRPSPPATPSNPLHCSASLCRGCCDVCDPARHNPELGGDDGGDGTRGGAGEHGLWDDVEDDDPLFDSDEEPPHVPRGLNGGGGAGAGARGKVSGPQKQPPKGGGGASGAAPAKRSRGAALVEAAGPAPKAARRPPHDDEAAPAGGLRGGDSWKDAICL